MQRISDNLLHEVSNKDVFRKYSSPALEHRKSHDAIRESKSESSSKRKDTSSKQTVPFLPQQELLDSRAMTALQRLGSMDSVKSVQSIPYHHSLDDDSKLDRDPSTSELLTGSLKNLHDDSYALPQPAADVENGDHPSESSFQQAPSPICQPTGSPPPVVEEVLHHIVKMSEKRRSLLPSLDVAAHNNRLSSLVPIEEIGKYNILVVDDSPLNRKMLSKLLKSKGHHIEEADNGQMAIDKVKQEADTGRTYDVILMDFVMPVMDGPSATRAIRSLDIRTPIFGLTGRVDRSKNVTNSRIFFQ